MLGAEDVSDVEGGASEFWGGRGGILGFLVLVGVLGFAFAFAFAFGGHGDGVLVGVC